MFKRKKPTTRHAEGIVVGGGATPAPVKKTKTKLMVGADVSPNTAGTAAKKSVKIMPIAVKALAVVVLVILGMLLFNKKTAENKVNTATAELNDISKKQDYDKIKDSADAVIAQAQTKEEKIKVYLQLASVAASDQQNKKAIEYYEAASKLDAQTSKQSAYVLALVYEADRNTAKAVEKYKEALAYYSEQKFDPKYEGTGDNSFYISSINNKLKQLGAQ